jgi:DNA-binding LacI/PurR family transcriptional regulator
VLWPFGEETEELSLNVAQGLDDGVLVLEVTLDDPRVALLTQKKVPFALMGRTSDPSALAYVDVDFEALIAEALSHLQGLGHQEIGLLVGGGKGSRLDNYGPIVRSRRSYEREMGIRELKPTILECDLTPDAGRASAHELMANHANVTAIIAINERAVVGLVSELRQMAVAVPERLSILSLVTSEQMGALADPRLAIYRLPLEEVSTRAVDLLIQRIERGTVGKSMLLSCTLQPGSTLAPPPRREIHETA